MADQRVIYTTQDYHELDKWFAKNNIKKAFMVCGRSVEKLNVNRYFLELKKRTGIEIVRFHDFSPNPDYASVEKGVNKFRSEGFDAIIAVGGGSAMDVAKCIKLFCGMDSSENYLKQEVIPNNIPFLAIPTTAGTGSEATRFAVIYLNGEKQSVDDESSIPDIVLLDSSVLQSLPLYQRKSTMLDALSHSVESFWSVNSTEESKEYSRKALALILENMDSYLANEDSGNKNMLLAANLAGKAINITQTTAGHAMCYKLTSLYGISHGHAAMLCNKELFPWMKKNTNKCTDLRGEEYLKSVLTELSGIFGETQKSNEVTKLSEIFENLSLEVPVAQAGDIEVLSESVNETRLKNHPVKISKEEIVMLYRKILKTDE